MTPAFAGGYTFRHFRQGPNTAAAQPLCTLKRYCNTFESNTSEGKFLPKDEIIANFMGGGKNREIRLLFGPLESAAAHANSTGSYVWGIRQRWIQPSDPLSSSTAARVTQRYASLTLRPKTAPGVRRYGISGGQFDATRSPHAHRRWIANHVTFRRTDVAGVSNPFHY